MMTEDPFKADSAETPFLSTKNDHEQDSLPDYEASQKGHSSRKSWLKRHRIAVLFHTLMILLYTTMVLFWCVSKDEKKRLLYTPIPEENVPHKIQVITDNPSSIRNSPFVSNSHEEADASWNHLLRFLNLRITDEEMKAMNLTSIAFSRGGGYHGMMGVFHQLHCLKLIREAVHRDHYYKGYDESKIAYMAGHTAHCIDILRAGVMCRADTMIYPYHWSERNRVPNPTWVQNHECVDWDRLTEWVETRRVDIKAPNMLVHPLYGPAYPGGESIEEPDGPKWYPLDNEY